MHQIIRRLLGSAGQGVQDIETSLERAAAPVRKAFYRRFPVIFTLLVAIGAVLTFLGLEQLILQTSFLRDNPLLMVVVGVTILVFTGKLLKKLG